METIYTAVIEYLKALEYGRKIETLAFHAKSPSEHSDATALAHILYTDTTLTSLVLDANIGDKGAIALADMLRHNRTLTRIELSFCDIHDAGAIALADSLANNTTLKYLDLGENRICDAGAIALAKALEINTTLTVLCLYANPITAEGVKALRSTKNKSFLLKLGYEWDEEDAIQKALDRAESRAFKKYEDDIRLHTHCLGCSTCFDESAA